MARRGWRSSRDRHSSYGYPEYVSVAERKRSALTQLKELERKTGRAAAPIVITARRIASSFWGKGWCDHFEGFSDLANRLPRGRTYARNGSIVDLSIERGVIHARVAGTSLYTVRIDIETLPGKRWSAVIEQCGGQIDSLVGLLAGKLSDDVMRVITARDTGLFPRLNELKMDCSCPDYATMCKHVAAVLYGAGARLDAAPELLFTLRGVDQQDLVAVDSMSAVTSRARGGERVIADDDLSAIFGIDLAGGDAMAGAEPAKKKPTAKGVAKKKAPTSASVAKKKTPAARKVKAVRER